MGKTLTVWEDGIASNIIDRSDVGNLTDNGDGTISATDADTTTVRNVLGEDNNNVGLLCKSSKANKWQRWVPGHLEYDTTNNEFYRELPSVYRLGDFLGYWHEAEKPKASNDGATYYQDDNTDTKTIPVYWDNRHVDFGEVQNVSTTYFVLKIYEDGTYIKTVSHSRDGSQIQDLDFTYDTTSLTKDVTLDVEVYLGSLDSPQALIRTLTYYLDYQQPSWIDAVIADNGDYTTEVCSKGISDIPNDEAYIDTKVYDSYNSTYVGSTFHIYTRIYNEERFGGWTTWQDTGSDYTTVSFNECPGTKYFTVPQGITQYGDKIEVKLIEV